jgi:outer membrane protein assembly factor BamA
VRSDYARTVLRGYSLSLSTEYAGPETGSEETLRLFRGRISGYVPLPWFRYHVLAANLSGGTSAGSYPSRGLFFTGGFAEENVIDTFESGIRQSAFVLRGYRPGQFVGQQFNLVNAEYRFPILFADRGVSTLPVFLSAIGGVVFADYGGAFDRIDLDDPLAEHHLGVGAEVRIGLVIGYAVSGTLRLGWAKGLDREALDSSQTYFVVVGGF